MTQLNQRIAKLEAATAGVTGAPRVIRLLCSQGQEDAAHQLALAEGWDEKSNDICIIRQMVSMTGKPSAPFAQVMSKSW